MDEQEGNIDLLLEARAKIDEELRQHKVLITILFTDVVGSTEYFDRFGDTAGMGMLHRHSDLATRTTEEFQGRVIKTIGDSVMAEFSAPILAVQAAAELQRRLLALNQKLPDRERLQLRIGMNHGPAMRCGTDVYGDAINLAARITKHTGPAQILVSSSIRDAVASETTIQCRCLGEISFKGKAEAAEVFEVVWTDTAIYSDLRASFTATRARVDLVSLRAGHKLGPYEVLAPIGAGGMGEVYRARDTRLDRTVAIKILPEQPPTTTQARERFEREAKAISGLNHPHICTLYDVGHQDGIDYLVMEYLEGQTLADRLKKGPLPLDQVLQYAIEIADALDTAHEYGVIHRDLKPGNVILTKTGAKLLDFGLAKLRAAEVVASATAVRQTTPLTGEGTILGTLQYMAPEQLEGKEAGARTDLFALGAVVYEMATGRKAFEGTSQASLISAILGSQSPAISLQIMSPPALDHLVQTCLAKDPEMRWSTAHDVLVELKWIVAVGSQVGVSKPVVAPGKRLILWLSALLAAVSIALLGIAFVHFREKPPEMRPLRFSIYSPEKVAFGDLNFGPVLISPDGSRLAFVGVDDTGKIQLWMRPLDALAAHPLAGTSNAVFPFWSSDSRYVGFFADGKLKKVSVDGGPPETVCDAPNGRGGSWGRASDRGPGFIIFAPDVEGGLWRVSASGGEPIQVTALDSSRLEVSHRQPEFLPDGRHFLYLAISKHEDKNSICIGDIQAKPDPKEVRRLMRGNAHVSYSPPGYLLFVRDKNLMAQAFDSRRLEFRGEPFVVADHVSAALNHNTSDFSVSANGVLAWCSSRSHVVELAWFDRSGKLIESLEARENWGLGRPALSPGSDRAAISMVDQSNPKEEIWLWDLVRGSKSRFTFGTHDRNARSAPVWSPDGRRIVFEHSGVSDHGLYWKDTGGVGNEKLLLKTARDSWPCDWSPDGRFILFTQENAERKTEMSVLPLFGNRSPVLVQQTEFNEGGGVFSPDGHWIAYISDESGRDEIYVRSFTEGGAGIAADKFPVSTSGGELPRWRRDGKELYFSALDGKLMSVPVKAGSTFATGKPVALFDTHLGSDFHYDVRFDGQRFLMIQRLSEGTSRLPVNVCLNWLAGIKK